MARSICLPFGALVILAGCGSTIGALDELPPGPDVTAAAWPRLVDTPEPPEARMTSGAGTQALERLTAQRSVVGDRKVRADAVAPVSDALAARLPEVEIRKAQAESVPPVSDTLLDRAATIQARTANVPAGFDDRALLERARRSAEVTKTAPVEISPARPSRPVPLRPLDQPTVSSEFEERARRARERAARAGS